jgi:phospholipase D1/2
MAAKRIEILREGETCWRIARAGRAAVLVDGAAYYGALRRALLKAERSVFIVGWDIDSRVELRGAADDGEDGAPRALGELLAYLVSRRPELRVYLLLWDYSMLYALEREPLPSLRLDWATPPQIKVCLDDVLPIGACHHQKIVVIDDAVAFSGGLDLTIRRWDTSLHQPGDPARRDPNGEPYAPFHDVQMCVDGEAAAALGELARERWLEAACERVPPATPASDPWPQRLQPQFRDVEIGVARTLPAFDSRTGVREVEALFLAAIDRAERLIYIENQFLTADRVAQRLARRMADMPRLEALLVSPSSHHGWIEARSMKAGRIRFMQHFSKAGVGERVRLAYPVLRTGDTRTPVMVHAKVMAVDDRFLRVGSANLNNRSMGMDSECDLAIEARSWPQRRAIAHVRDRLIGEHLGRPAAAVAEAIAAEGPVLAALDRLARPERGLEPIIESGADLDAMSDAVSDLADPEQPLEASLHVGDMFGGLPARRSLGRIAAICLVGVALVALALAWRYTPLAGLTEPAALRSLLGGALESRWAPLLVPALFALGGLLAFPVTVLIATTAMLFDPGQALLYAGMGSLLSAVVTYEVGAVVGRRALRRLMGTRLNRISRALARKGVFSVLAVRLVPVAPFTLINLAAGVSHIRFADYTLGTALGMAPGIVIITALGHRLARALSHPSLTEIGMLALVVLAWLAVSVSLQVAVIRLRSTTRA